MARRRVHMMPFAVQDWRTSRVRARSIRDQYPLLRLVYLELLFALWENGGTIADDPEALGDDLGLELQEVSDAVDRLVEMGRLERVDGRLENGRVREDLGRELAYREGQSARVRARWSRRRNGNGSAGGAVADARCPACSCVGSLRRSRRGGWYCAVSTMSPGCGMEFAVDDDRVLVQLGPDVQAAVRRDLEERRREEAAREAPAAPAEEDDPWPEQDSEAAEAWGAVADKIKARLHPHNYAQWFRPCRGWLLEDGVLTVRVPSVAFEEAIVRNYAEAVREAAGRSVRFTATP